MASPLRIPDRGPSGVDARCDAGIPADLRNRLEELGQAHVFAWWPQLSAALRAGLVRQLRELDFDSLEQSIAYVRRSGSNRTGQADVGLPAANVADELQPPRDVIRQDASFRRHADHWRCLGEQSMARGEVAAVVVAGGMGTRLGWPRPKGLFPVGPVTGKPLFQWHVEQIVALRGRLRAAIPLVVMTSTFTHEATVQAFAEHRCWGLPPHDVTFVCQGEAPALDRDTGRLLMAAPHRLATAPDGHGGLFGALQREGTLEQLRRRGVRRLFYFQIDNPGTRVCDPEFVGCHLARRAEVSVRVIRKQTPEERVGVVVFDGRVHRIVEYIDLPRRLAEAEAPPGSGKLRLWAGNTAVHIFELDFLVRCARDGVELPWHHTTKAIPYFDSTGRWVRPTAPNAVKLERFIFDLLPFARRVLVVEADRRREYLPLKNRVGENSPHTVRQGLISLAAERIQRLGGEVAAGTAVEIDPRWNDERLARAIAQTPRITTDTYFGD
ncbi:MAG: UDPGP type 1 family protein [Planctomycetota bacterium]|nr:MAG: UDPGP type 1 family protein [Planctomycetota bacterium]